MDGEPAIVATVRGYLEYLKREGWQNIQYQIRKSERGEPLLSIEFDDGAGGDRGGNFWPVEVEDLDNVQSLLESEGIARESEEVEDDPNESYRKGLRDGFIDGFEEGLRQAEREDDNEDWKHGQ